jgi:hypothetical protein
LGGKIVTLDDGEVRQRRRDITRLSDGRGARRVVGGVG